MGRGRGGRIAILDGCADTGHTHAATSQAKWRTRTVVGGKRVIPPPRCNPRADEPSPVERCFHPRFVAGPLNYAAWAAIHSRLNYPAVSHFATRCPLADSCRLAATAPLATFSYSKVLAFLRPAQRSAQLSLRVFCTGIRLQNRLLANCRRIKKSVLSGSAGPPRERFCVDLHADNPAARLAR